MKCQMSSKQTFMEIKDVRWYDLDLGAIFWYFYVFSFNLNNLTVFIMKLIAQYRQISLFNQ